MDFYISSDTFHGPIIDFDHHEFLFNFNRDENIVVVYFKKIKQNSSNPQQSSK